MSPGRLTMSQLRRPRGGRAAGAAVLGLLAGVLVPAAAATAAPAPAVANLYVAPAPAHAAGAAGAAGAGTAQQPFTSMAQAEQTAHQLSASSDVVVHLAGGVYRLT